MWAALVFGWMPVIDDKDKKDRKDKRKCRDFRHPGRPQPLRAAALPESTSGDAMPKWFYLVNGLSQQSNPPQQWVLTDQSTTPTNGAQLVIAPIQSGLRGQLWRAEPLGNGYAYLQSGLGNGLLLSYAGACGSQSPVVQYPSQVNSPVSGANALQQWKYSGAGTVTIGADQVPVVTIGNSNCAGGQLFVIGNTPAANAPVALGTGAAAPGNRWFAWPNYPLDAILNIIRVQFPVRLAVSPV
jgi:hypothetical protein